MRHARVGGGRPAAPLLAAVTALLLAGCSGLPAAREMGDMALLRTLGVDPSPAGVAVTGSTGPRAKGLQGDGEPALTLAADGASLSGACLVMQGQSDSFVFFGYVDQLLLGEKLAEEGVRPVLDYFSRNAELGLGAQLWLVRSGSAREALSAGGEKGLDSRLDIRGANLSGGQRQRLLAARALAGRPSVLVLDSADSALDYRTAAALHAAVRRDFPGVTLVVISERVASLREADRILVLEEGRLTAQGTHEELLETCGRYRRMAELQMGGLK